MPAHAHGSRGGRALVLALALLLGAAWALGPLAAREALPWLAAKWGLTLAFDQVELRPFDLGLTLRGVRLDAGEPLLRAGEVQVSLDPWDLTYATLSLDRLRIASAQVPLVRPGTGDLPRPPAALLALLGSLRVNRLEVADLELQDADRRIPRLVLIEGALQDLPGPDLPYSLRAVLGGGRIHSTGDAVLYVDETEIRGRLDLQGLDIGEPSGLPHREAPLARGRLDAQLRLTARLGAGGLFLELGGAVRLPEIAVAQGGYRIETGALAWQGDLEIETAGDGALLLADARGRAEIERIGVAAEAPGAARLDLHRGQWEGRLAWSGEAPPPRQWSVEGDGRAQRLELHPASGQALVAEEVAVWGLMRTPDSHLRVGRAQARRLQPLALDPPPWTVEDLEAEELDLPSAGTPYLASLILGPSRAAGPDAGWEQALQRARLDRLALDPGRVRADSLTASGLSYLPPDPDVPGGLRLAELGAVALGLVQGRLSAEHVRARGLTVEAGRDAGGRWQIPLPAGAPLAVEFLQIEGESRLTFVDRAVSPPSRIQVGALQGRWLSGAAGRDPHLFLEGRVGDGHVALSATPLPSGASPRLRLEGRGEGLPVASLAGYARPALDAELNEGWMDFSFSVAQQPSGWAGHADLRLQHIDLVRERGGSRRGETLLALIGDEAGRAAVSLGFDPGVADRPLERALERGLREAVLERWRSAGVTPAAVDTLLREGRLPLPPGEAGEPAGPLDVLGDALVRHPQVNARLCGAGAEAAGLRIAERGLDPARLLPCGEATNEGLQIWLQGPRQTD